MLVFRHICREVKVSIGMRFIFQSEVPPFLGQEPETVIYHSLPQDHTVVDLFLGQSCGIVGMRQFAAADQRCAHQQHWQDRNKTLEFRFDYFAC